MKTFYRYSLSLLAFLFIASSTVFAQQSDFRIQQDFRSGYASIMEQLDRAETADEFAAIEDEIDALETQFSEHSSIINSAIYPDSFSDRISAARAEAEEGRQHALTVEELNTQITNMTGEMDEFRDRLTAMDSEAASLREEIERSEASERRQAALIRQYRQNVEQRNLFVMNFLEELLTNYHDMDAAEVDDVIQRTDENPLLLINTIISEYINNVDQATDLAPRDYISMRAQHAYFANVWERIGENLSETFAPDEPVQAQQEVTDRLAAWQASVDNKLWNSITTTFNQNDIQLETFTNSETFNSSLNTYVDSGIEVSRESNTEEDYQMYRNFSSFWNNTVKTEWGEQLIQGNVLSQSQMAAIDIKLNQWGETATPTSNLMFILFLISIAVIIGLVVLLITKK